MAQATKSFTWSDGQTGLTSRPSTRKTGTRTFSLPSDYVSGGTSSGGTHSISLDRKSITFTSSAYPQVSERKEPYQVKETVWGPIITYIDYAGNGPLASGDRLVSKRTLPDGRVEWKYQEQTTQTVTKYRSIYTAIYYYTVRFTYETNAAPPAPSWIEGGSNLTAEKLNTITWASVSDADGDSVSYELIVQYGQSTSEISLYKGTNTTFQHTLPLNAEQVKYSVRATDGKDFSEYTSTSLIPVSSNAGPVITGQDTDLGVKNVAFTYTYRVTDPDGDPVIITESLNGVTFNTLNNAPQNTDLVCRITGDQLKNLSTNSSNTLEIKASDSKGNTTYRRLVFSRTNVAPEIVLTSTALGNVTGSLTLPITFNDADGDNMDITVSLNAEELLKQNVKNGTKINFTIAKEKFLRIEPGVVQNLVIRAVDPTGASTSKRVTFTRVVNRVEIKAKYTSTNLDAVVNSLFVTIRWLVAEGAVPTVMLCNNANDANPAWEDCTKSILDRTDCILVNNTKTAATWAIGVWIKIERGTSKDISWISSIGGAIK